MKYLIYKPQYWTKFHKRNFHTINSRTNFNNGCIPNTLIGVIFMLERCENMVFTKDSGLAKIWVSIVMVETYTIEQVPDLFNLKEVVTEVVSATA